MNLALWFSEDLIIFLLLLLLLLRLILLLLLLLLRLLLFILEYSTKRIRDILILKRYFYVPYTLKITKFYTV